MSEVDVSAGLLRYEEPVMFLILKDNTELNPANLQELADSARQLSQGRPYLLFSDARVNLGISQEGAGVAAQPQLLSLVGASAILVSSWSKKLIANLYIRFNKTPFPMRLFTSAKEALNWLELQKNLI